MASHPRPDEGTRGVEFVDSHTRVHGGSSFHAFSEPPTRLSGESQSSYHCKSDTISLYSKGHLTVVTDHRSAASREAMGNHTRDRKRSGTSGALRFRERSRRATDLRHGPKAQTDTGSNEQPVMTTMCGRMTNPPPEGNNQIRPKAKTGCSQQESKTPSRGSVPFDEIRCADR